MSIWQNIKHKHVLLEVLSKNKVNILKEFSESFVSEFTPEEIALTFDSLLSRERLSSTAIGAGIAIPHARLEHVKETHVLIAKSPKGVNFDAIDEKPVNLLFCVLSPVSDTEGHLKILARISKFLHDTSFKEHLIKAETGQEILQTIDEKDTSY